MEAKVFFEETCMDNVSGANSFIGCDSSFFEETCMDNVSGAKSVKHGGKKNIFL